MKLVRSNGRALEVREVGEVIFRLAALRGPIKCNGSFVLDDGEARELCRELAKARGEPEV
jgi:hypothetical protein